MGLLDGMNWEKENPKEAAFHKKRTMFYLDKVGLPVFPESEYENLSHSEWFNKVDINIDTTIRGYVGDDYIHLYIGEYFSVPEISSIQLRFLITYFTVNKIKLGCKVGKVGEIWESIYEFRRSQYE